MTFLMIVTQSSQSLEEKVTTDFFLIGNFSITTIHACLWLSCIGKVNQNLDENRNSRLLIYIQHITVTDFAYGNNGISHVKAVK